MKEKNLVHIGTFHKPLGLKGEIKIITHTYNYMSFQSIDSYLNDKGESVWNFVYLKIHNKKLIGLLKEHNTRNLSEKLIGKKIFADRNKLTKKEKNFFDLFNLKNFKIFNIENKLLGKVISVDNFGAGDLINVKQIKIKSIYIPMNDENVEKIDKVKKLLL